MNKILALLAIVPVSLGSGTHGTCFNPNKFKQLNVQEKCLATTIYGEARGESLQGMVAVAYTVINRAVNRTICAVVLAKKQYSIYNNNAAYVQAATNATIEPPQKNIIDKRSWEQSIKAARLVINNEVTDPTKGSTNYIAPMVMRQKHYHIPKWSKEFKLVAIIDNHRFYKKV